MGDRLRNAISPYLRSHADNPVDWFPWSAEAFAVAKQQDRPVMISVGYSSCHWCHVMARESFSDPVIGEILNTSFVSIKVDREEHPEVDASLMTAASAFTRNLGWPLTVFATPQGKVFYAGSYFPPEPAHGLPSFRQLLDAILEAWQQRRDQVETQSEELRLLLQQSGQDSDIDRTAIIPHPDAVIAEHLERLVALEDPEQGGFGQGSKFPNAPALRYLAEVAFAHSHHPLAAGAREVLLRTLERMAASALRDPIEGGFFRYTVQANFTEPHYERMLYDNAQLLEVYLLALLNADTAELKTNPTRAQLFSDTAYGIADYLMMILQQSEGGFASAQDSESDIDGVRTEGGYYQLDVEQRRLQPAPALDRKILTGWNGLAIAALSRYGQLMGRNECILAASQAAEYLIQHHLQDGVLFRASESGRVSSAVATLEDYGLFAHGLLTLGLVIGEVRYVNLARQLVQDCITQQPDGTIRFVNPDRGDPVLAEQGTLLSGDQPDAAMPSPLVAIALAGHLLAQLSTDERLATALHTAWQELAPTRNSHPLAAAGAFLIELRLATPPSQLIVSIIQDAASPVNKNLAKHSLMQLAQGQYGVLAVLPAANIQAFSTAGFDLFNDKLPRHNETTVYECHNFVCALPKSAAEFFSDQRV